MQGYPSSQPASNEDMRARALVMTASVSSWRDLTLNVILLLARKAPELVEEISTPNRWTVTQIANPRQWHSSIVDEAW